MTDEMNRSAFDKLVAGMDAVERSDMLEKINQSAVSVVQLVETEDQYPEKNVSLHIRFKGESAFYRFFLWLRSLLEKKDPEKIYNEDVLASMARRINRDHLGILNHKNGLIDSVFYEHLRSLRSSAEFFKPYFNIIDENPGDFYVFLSSFVTPELSDIITAEADPFSLSFDTEPDLATKNRLLKNLDSILNNIDGAAKSNLYSAVSSLNWLRQFTRLPYIHFTSQFTNLTGNHYTCPYRNAVNDFSSFAAVFSNVMSVQNEVLEAMLMFSQRKEITKNAQDKDIERTIKEFIAKANQCFGIIQMFISNVPIIKV